LLATERRHFEGESHRAGQSPPGGDSTAPCSAARKPMRTSGRPVRALCVPARGLERGAPSTRRARLRLRHDASDSPKLDAVRSTPATLDESVGAGCFRGSARVRRRTINAFHPPPEHWRGRVAGAYEAFRAPLLRLREFFDH
jgi:hypothetical protein